MASGDAWSIDGFAPVFAAGLPNNDPIPAATIRAAPRPGVSSDYRRRCFAASVGRSGAGLTRHARPSSHQSRQKSVMNESKSDTRNV